MITRGILVRLHVEQGKTPQEIAVVLNCPTTEVYQALIKYGVMHPATMNNEIVTRFEAGQSEHQISRDMGLNRRRVSNVVHTTGHEHRTRGHEHRTREPVAPVADADTVTRYRDGASIRTLAAEAGISYGAMRWQLKDAGVTLRGRGGNRGRR